MKTQTCEERIRQEWEARKKEIKKALKRDAVNWVVNNTLGLSKHNYYRAYQLLLSWGGPSDFLLFFEDGTIEYHFLDWFDSAQIELTGEDYETAKTLWDEIKFMVEE